MQNIRSDSGLLQLCSSDPLAIPHLGSTMSLVPPTGAVNPKATPDHQAVIVSLGPIFQGVSPLLIAIAIDAVASAMWLLSSSIGSALPGLKVRFRSDQITRL